MKIAFSAYPTVTLLQGGGRTIIEQHKDYLKNKGYDVHLLNPWVDNLKDFDIVHHFGIGYGNYDFFCTLKEAHKKLVLTPIYYVHQRIDRIMRKFFSKFFFLKTPPALVKAMFDMTDHIILPADGIRKMIYDLYSTDKDKMTVIPYAVSNQFIDADSEPFIKKYGYEDFALCVGRFDPRQKNQLGLIQVLSDTDIPLIFLGSQVFGEEEYYNQCVKASSSNMVFIDHIEQAEGNMLPSAFAAARLVAIPSFFEYPSLVTMEAMLARTSVAMSDGGIARDVFKDFVQYFNPHSSQDMRDTITNAYNQSHKQSQIEDAYHYAYNTFSWASVGPQIEEVYQRIV